nr:hypothetical protein [Tanacetum cinerariifolium]
MRARGARNNLVTRRVIDDLIDISQERSPLKYLKIFIEQKLPIIVGLLLDKMADFNRLIAVAEEKIHGKEIDLEMLEAEGNDG